MPPRRRIPLMPIAGVAAVALALAGCGSSSSSSSTASTSQTTSSAAQAPALLAPVASAATGQTVDGIKCDTQEQAVYHIHAHLAVYVNGSPRIVPEGIGIAPPRQEEASSEGPFVVAGSCFYWLHAHTPDGIVHIESPDQRLFTLGQFFDIWHQPLSANQVGPALGKVTAYVDGKPFSGDPRNLALLPHRLIQLDVGAPVVPPQSYSFPPGL